jgi:hypothetical protein
VHGSRQNQPVGDVLSGRPVIAFRKRIERVADPIHVVEEFAQDAAPGFGARQRIVQDQAESGEVGLQMDRKPVVPRPVVASEDSNVGDILLLGREIAGIKRREKRVAGLVYISAVAVVALLVSPVRAQRPMGIERMLNAGAGMQRIRRLVSRIDQRTGAAVSRSFTAWNAVTQPFCARSL